MYAFCDLTTILIINIVVRSQKLSENSQLVRATSYQLGFFNFVKTEKNLIRYPWKVSQQERIKYLFSIEVTKI